MIIIVKVCRSDAGAPEVRTSFLHKKCEVWRPVWPRAKSLGSWGSHVGPRCCWHLNPNFWVTNVPRSSNSVLPRTLWPPRAGPCAPHSPGPRSVLQSPRRAPSGTSPPPAAAAHAPAPPPPHCPLQHRAGSARRACPTDVELGGLRPGAVWDRSSGPPQLMGWVRGPGGCGAITWPQQV